jgi:glutaredoxin
MQYVVYGKPQCQFCTRAIIAIKSAGHTYEYKSLDEDFTREELLEKFPDAKTFPQIETEDGTYIGGFTELREHLK